MQTRRDFIRHGVGTGAVIAVAGGLSLTSCGGAGIAAAGPFLKILGTAVVQGFGMKIGDALASDMPEWLRAGFDHLQGLTAEGVNQAVLAVAPELADASQIRGLVAGNFVIDQKVHSQAVHDNNGQPVNLPSVMTLGLALLAKQKAEQLVALDPTISSDVALALMRAELQLNVAGVADGEDSLGSKVRYRAVTVDDRSIEVEWDPTTSNTELSRLSVRRGLVLKGKDPIWEEDSSIEIGIPSYKLWGPIGRSPEDNLSDTAVSLGLGG
jgi:hypothetical protein